MEESDREKRGSMEEGGGWRWGGAQGNGAEEDKELQKWLELGSISDSILWSLF